MSFIIDQFIMDFRTYFILFYVFAIGFCNSKVDYEEAKKELEDYISRRSSELNPRYRLYYHVTPPVGWMNDPNGFSYYKGQFHLFYQFYPYDSFWGPMHWGHSSSSNLVDWQTLPTALLPGDEECFSGSAVCDGDTMTLMYTAHETTDQDPYYKETQFLAHSTDGVNFTKYRGNPVLPAAPNGSPDFRDPKVWKHKHHWYAVIGSKSDDSKRGRVLLYRSTDMIHWAFLRVLKESTGNLGYMWECPDFFELDGKYVLLFSPQGMAAEGDRYKNVFQTGFVIGSFNYDTFEFVQETDFQEIDYGHDFYASQTIEKDGKRYLVAWFNMWEKAHPEAEDGWAGAMTIIRELKIVGERVLMKPVEEMIDLRANAIIKGPIPIGENVEIGPTGEIIINVDLDKPIVLKLTGREGGDFVKLQWDPKTEKVVVDRSGDVRQVEWYPIGSHSWRLFLDASSLELFCGEGEVVFSSRAYPNGYWSLNNASPQPLEIEVYTLRRSVPM